MCNHECEATPADPMTCRRPPRISNRACNQRSLFILPLLSTLLILSNVLSVASAQEATSPEEGTGIPRRTAPSDDDLYILLDEISVFSCRGVKNEIKLTEEDVNVVNEKGNRVYFIKAPGNYSLHFKKINVLNDFGHLTGEIGITLQVPILEGPNGIRFDVPYTMVPETGLLNQQCDEFSGIVERDKRQYCRYCELCGLSEKIESTLAGQKGGHQFLPEVAKGDEQPFAPKCGKIGAKTYEFKRTINLPGRRELEDKVKQKINGVDAEIKKRLNKGRGRFQVFLNLISADQPPISQKAWFDGSEQCRCCGRDKDPNCRNVLSFLYCNAEDCKSAWAQQCLHNSAKIAACYTVEFNYRMTVKHEDVVEFLRENNYPNQEVATRPPPPATTSAPQHRDSDSSKLPKSCVDAMPARLTHLRRYCTIFWNEKLCCTHCEGVC
ncbi:hypothetical protein DdX_05162 [Ditylenchus destructor]|uniref:Uncharacterized protein n=1 Tax=Ditylenchus destructor TaxID=166010 RepID=A0AAD4RAT2_9BILA|nr:hypothetical protein DdX_05162 [Ditylenchus destructor]